MSESGWTGVTWDSWKDLALIRARLDAGADPNTGTWGEPPLHQAAEHGSPEVVAELASRVDDVDALDAGRTALWTAVYHHRPDNARALVTAGADPWLPMMSGWSPGRLSLAGPNPLGAARSLSTVEEAAVAEGERLRAALGELWEEGVGLACVAAIDSGEAARRLGAEPLADESVVDDAYEMDPDESLMIIGVTTVPGGCVVTQPWGFAPSMPRVTEALSKGTVCYGLYCNPKSGDQGSVTRDGVVEGWDLSPGDVPDEGASAEEVLTAYLYQDNAFAYCCGYVGLRPTDARAIAGPPDAWLRLPSRDYWN